ncbi:MAG: hypothetical protein KDA81_08240 [Planctomycetaceae bacterium]|nr:hypothetical protein [Planctomycetaceae bacterium]
MIPTCLTDGDFVRDRCPRSRCWCGYWQGVDIKIGRNSRSRSPLKLATSGTR